MLRAECELIRRPSGQRAKWQSLQTDVCRQTEKHTHPGELQVLRFCLQSHQKLRNLSHNMFSNVGDALDQ